MKQPLPVWSIVAALAGALVVVTLLFTMGGSGEASKDELIKIRQNQRSFSAGPPTANGQGSGPVVPPSLSEMSPESRGVGSMRTNQPSYANGAPPGAINGNVPR